MGNLSPWRRKMDELLEKEGPLPFDLLVYEMSRLIPPGRAYRQAEQERLRQRNDPSHEYTMTGRPYSAPPKRHQQKTLEELVRIGARQIAIDTIFAARARGTHEFVEKEGERYVELVRKPQWMRLRDREVSNDGGTK